MIRTQNQQGFALFIVAALFIAFALIASAMIDRTNATQQLALQKNTQEKLSKLSYALIRYALDHSDRYPCPADPQIPVTDPTFGTAIAACETGVTGGVVELTGLVSIRGMVPVKELLPYGIDLNDAFDSWDNRIMININRNLTQAGDGSRPSGNLPVVSEAVLAVPDYLGSDFLLISYGRDGIGATPKSAISVTIACTVDGSPRMANCDDDLGFSIRPIRMGPNVTAAEYYDDLVSFYAFAKPF